MIYHLLHNRTTCIAGRLFKTSYSLQLQVMIELKQRKTLTATVTPAFLPICKYWTLLKLIFSVVILNSYNSCFRVISFDFLLATGCIQSQELFIAFIFSS